MVKIDLITGFLGSGKTTFIREYVQYLLKRGEKVCILENDYGAINVDMMLLRDLRSDRLGLEMVAGGCDYDCHVRRFRTKLITMAMLGYQRVIVEPSGIFDVDEFYDLLHEDRLADMYEIANVIAIVNARPEQFSEEADAMFASQIATAGKLVLSHVSECSEQEIQDTVCHINTALEKIRCVRRFALDENVVAKDWQNFTDEDFAALSCSGYRETGYIKKFSMDENGFEALFFMNPQGKAEEIVSSIRALWKDEKAGKLIRIKGFLQKDDNSWIEVNATAERTEERAIAEGQKIIIVIGEKLNTAIIDTYLPAEYSTSGVLESSQAAVTG